MAKKFFDHRDIKWPGTWLIENDLPSAIPNIPDNRTMFIQQFTDEPPSDVDFVDDCQTMPQAFDKFKPGKTINLENMDGVEEEVDLKFNSLMDFGRKGIVGQSDLMSQIESKRGLFESFMGKLTDEQLAILLANPEEKAAYISVLKELIGELEAADPETVENK